MKMTHRILSFALAFATTFGSGLFGVAEPQAQAHFPCRLFCHARPYCPPPVVAYGGTGIWGCGFYRGYYGINGGCWPSYSYYNCPTVFCPPVVYPPVYYAPFCYRSVVYVPSVTYYDPCPPIDYSPVIETQWIESSEGAVYQSQRPTLSVSSKSRVTASSLTRAGRSPRTVRVSDESLAKQVVQPYSPVWTDAAVGVLDDLVARGDFEVAYKASQRMEKVGSPLNHRVLLRQGLLELIANRDAMDAEVLEQVMDRFAQAADAGSEFQPTDLGGKTVSEYLDGSAIALDDVLDVLAKRVLANPSLSGREMVTLSVLLSLDVQTERSQLFHSESRTLAAHSDGFRWQSILRSLDRQSERDALLAAKDVR